MKTASRGIPLNCCKVIHVCCSMKSITLKINDQTFKYKIKVQALKDTSWTKQQYLTKFFCTKSIKQPQLFLTNWLLFCLIIWRVIAFHIAGQIKNELFRKWICCSNCVLLKLNNVCSCIKSRWVSLNKQWPSG